MAISGVASERSLDLQGGAAGAICWSERKLHGGGLLWQSWGTSQIDLSSYSPVVCLHLLWATRALWGFD